MHSRLLALVILGATSLLTLLPAIATADDNAGRAAPVGERTLRGTYVFSGRVLLNPIVNPGPGGSPSRVLIACFSLGEVHFDGRGHVSRRVEIQCPTTPELLATGLGAPPPVGEPTAMMLAQMGTTYTSSGTYALGADGRGSLSDTGSYRLGALPGNPGSGDALISVSSVRGGLAHKVHILLRQQSVQPPGAPMLINSDIGGSFVAFRR